MRRADGIDGRNRRWLLRGIAIAVTVLAGIAIGIQINEAFLSQATSETTTPKGPTLAMAMRGLCQARSSATRADVPSARKAFLDQSHLYLHSLASDLDSRDRNLEGELLLAKWAVESALSLPTVPGATPTVTPSQAPLPTLLDDLIAVTQRAASSLGLEATAC